MKFILLLILGVTTALAEETKILKDFAVGNNLFASDIYKELLKFHSGNFLVCPLSAEIILALVYNGAGGKTAQELSVGLHLPKEIQQTIEHLAPHLEGGDKYILNTANKIYIKDGYKINEQFKTTAVTVFETNIQNINFEKNTEAAKEINRWVKEKTQNNINNLIEKDDLNEDNRAVLISAMYFHGKWMHKFPIDATTALPFYPHINKEIKVLMMQQLNNLRYYECSELNAKFVELPYEGNDVTMTIVLPNEKEGLYNLETHHITDVFTEHKYETRLIDLKLPKFDIESTLEFKPILEALGIKEAFTNSADFQKIVVGENHLKISKVIQKTSIGVEEHGTMASGATRVEMPIYVSSLYVPPSVTPFVADHPFIFFIKIKDIVLFVGRYTGV